MSGPIRVFVVDDHEMVRRGVRELLEGERDMVVTGEAATDTEALARVATAEPDVALLDVRLGSSSGVELCRDIRSRHPDVACLMLTSFADDEALLDSVVAGAVGFVLKQVRGSELVEQVRIAAAGRNLLPPEVVEAARRRLRVGPDEDPRLAALSGQERKIVDLVADGLSNREIGERLFLAEKTVKNYMSNVLMKLGMSRRTEVRRLRSAFCRASDPRDMTSEDATLESVMPEPVGALGTAGAEQLRMLLGAVLAIGVDLDLEAVLSRVVETAVALVGARYGALGVVDATGTHLTQFVTAGIDAADRAAIGDPPMGHGILGRLIVEAEPWRLADIARHPDSAGFPPGHPTMTTFLGIPIFLRGDVYGTLYLADKRDPATGAIGQFSDADEELLTGLATAAAVAIDNARLHARAREIDVIEDRERIARDLHDTVIQRLFATGLSLQAAVRLVDRPEAVQRIQRTIDDLDETVRQIRFAIFGLHVPPIDLRGRGGLRTALTTLVRDYRERLGFEPRLQLEGPLDTMVDPELGEHVLTVVREGLENVARHAGAAEATVTVSLSGVRVVVRVEDRGVGPSVSAARGGGLADLIDRAEALGGTATFAAREGGGASLDWSVPLRRGA